MALHSIRLRLIGLYVLVVTVTLVAVGTYAQLLLSRELELEFSERQNALLLRLATSLPSSIWNYDVAQSKRIVDAELRSIEVCSITVFDNKSQVFVQSKASHWTSVPASPAEQLMHPSHQMLLFLDAQGDPSALKPDPSLAIGRVEVVFSRHAIEASLHRSWVQRAVEILVLDCILIFALVFSLKMIFGPVRQLRDALFELAKHHGEDAEELPETSRNEFGEVVRGFNQTQRKLRQVIARRAQAEDAAREAAAKAESAYLELKATQQQLMQSERLAGLGGMVAGVAHEINTPLGILTTSASVLKQATEQTNRALSEGQVRKSELIAYLKTADESTRLILNNAERAAHLVQSFKQVAADQTSEHRRRFDLQSYLDDLVTSLHPALKQRHATVTVHCPPGVSMDSYPGLLAQVLTNLTMNALAHAFQPGQKGMIDIDVKVSSDDMVAIAFVDDGCGIPAEHMGRIFDPFFTTRRDQGGTGLGLHIVFNIVTQQLKGSITARNMDPQGACFDMLLPRVTPQVNDKETA